MGKNEDNPVPSLDNIINIIESCDELQLPNGAKGAIWKEDLIYKLQNGVETNKEQPNLLKIYEDFRDSEILEGHDESIILAFLYYIKRGNLENKSFNIHYYGNTEKNVINSRLLDLEKLYNTTIEKNTKETLEIQKLAKANKNRLMR